MTTRKSFIYGTDRIEYDVVFEPVKMLVPLSLILIDHFWPGFACSTSSLTFRAPPSSGRRFSFQSAAPEQLPRVDTPPVARRR